MASTLAELERKLTELSHSEAAIAEIEAFAKTLKDTRERLAVLNAAGAIIRAPIRLEEAQALGFNTADDVFTLLQGDIVATEAAYYLGERVAGYPKYIVLGSSCDLVPERRKCAGLLRVTPIFESETGASAKLSLALKFRRRDSMYLPVMPQDPPGVLCNVVEFDGICQIRSSDLLLANRLASLSLVGWRIFASFSRTVIARSTARETNMRVAIENQPQQTDLGFSDQPANN